MTDVVMLRCTATTRGGGRCTHTLSATTVTDVDSALCSAHVVALSAPRCPVLLAHGRRAGEVCGRLVKDAEAAVCSNHVRRVVTRAPEVTLRATNVVLSEQKGPLVVGQRVSLTVEAEVLQVRGDKSYAQPTAVSLRRGPVPSGSVDVSKPPRLVEVVPADDDEESATDFWAHVVPRGECWAWSGPRDETTGVPVAVVDGKQRHAARVAWGLEHGRLGPRDRLVRRCKTAGCISPEHHAVG